MTDGGSADGASVRTVVERAARNNALWCDAVCRAHGRSGRFEKTLWIHRGETPPRYPNVVTLARDADPSAVRARIGALRESGLRGAWAVKDSFRSLDLDPLGFRILLEGRWVGRPARLGRPDAAGQGIEWAPARAGTELADWEAAWADDGRVAGPAGRPSLFLAPLAADPDVAVIGGHRGGRIVAGAIANRGAGVVGLSNLFGPADELDRVHAGCVAAAMRAFPGLDLVGWAHGPELDSAVRLGFEILGPLRVWAHAGGAAG